MALRVGALVTLSSRDRLEAQGYERRRLLAAVLGDPRLIGSNPWRPVFFGGLVAGVLLAGSTAARFSG